MNHSYSFDPYSKDIPYFKVELTHLDACPKIHVDHLIDAIAKYCSQLQRLEFR